MMKLLTKLLRRRTALVGLVCLLVVFMICAYTNNLHTESRRELHHMVGGHKRLQQADQPPVEAVQFIPGVPGHSFRNIPKEPPNHSGPSDSVGKSLNYGLYKEEANKHSPYADKKQQQRSGANIYQVIDLAQNRKSQSRVVEEENGGTVHLGNGHQQDTVHLGNGHQQDTVHLGNGHQQFYQQIGREPSPKLEMDSNVEYVGEGNTGESGPVYFAQHQKQFQAYQYQQQQQQQQQQQYYRGQYNSVDGTRNEMPMEPVIPLYIPPHRIVHFDLKGAPPRMDYLQKVLKIIKELGGTGILMEWEDMFPFSGRLKKAAALNHYTVEEAKELLATAKDLGLEVIPLVQTFGHMEFILKLEQFAYLRDADEMPESICPCHNDTMPLIKEYIDQVMALHRGAKYLHIGCDEVYHLGTCTPCMDRNRNSVFSAHVGGVAEYVKDRYRATPIIWDDMLRNFMEEEMRPLSRLVEPMVWVYAEDVYRFVPSYTWERYSHVFDYLWTASSFKGAHGETLVVPPAGRHLVNNLNWVDLMREEGIKLRGGFKGIVVTGWQRYDHFSVLCELLPSGLPSMALDLITLTKGYYNSSLGAPLFSALNCADHKKYENFIDLETDTYLWDSMSWCYFPGSNVFRMTRNLVTLEKEVEEFLDTVHRKKGWLTQYSSDHNYSSPYRIEQLMEDWSRYQHEVVSLMNMAGTALLEVFDYHTQGEWIEQKIYPMYKKLSDVRQEADRLKSFNTWGPRPLKTKDVIKQLGYGVPPTKPPPPPPPTPSDSRPKRRVQAQDLYSSRARQRALGSR